MKKFITILLAGSMLLSMCGCDKKVDLENEVQPNTEITEIVVDSDEDATEDPMITEDVAEAEEKESDDSQTKKEFALGTVSGERYQNDFIGLSFTLPENWEFYTTEEIMQLNQATSDMAGEDYKKAMESSNVVYDMMACSDNQLENVNVILEKNSLVNTEVEIKKMYENSQEMMKQTLENMGASNVTCEITTETFAGEEMDAMYISSNIAGTSMKQVSVALKVDGYLVNVTATATDDATLKSILSAFSLNR